MPLGELTKRIAEEIDAFSRIGGDEGGGVSRLAYTVEEREAHGLLARIGDDDGARPVVDRVGNTQLIYAEGEPFVLLGSHLDTVRQGGRYDGTLGVVVARAAARLCRDGFPPGTGLRVVAFAGEEGARFGRPLLGSSLAMGLLTAGEADGLVDADGVSLARAAAELGFEPGGRLCWDASDVLAFLECHIEQGRVLERAGLPIGVVSAIAGSVRLRVRLTGEAAHSGTTPMGTRSDPLATAAEVVLGVESLARSGEVDVGTVGRLRVVPNGVTTIAGSVELWIDLRDTDASRQAAAEETARDLIGRAAMSRGVVATIDLAGETAPVVLSPEVGTILSNACGRLSVPHRTMVSGAGHDTAALARRVPTGLLFVPCEGGVSHSPDELADPADAALGAVVLAQAAREIAAAP